jgi:isopenicillin-N epimerase
LVNRWQQYAESQPLRFYDREVLPLLVDVIRRYAKFLNCKPTELVFVENCTFAFNSVLKSIDIKKNEKIFIFNTTYGVYKKILKIFCNENSIELIEEQILFPILTQFDFDTQIVEKLKKKLEENNDIKYVFVDYIPSNHPFRMPIEAITQLCHSIRPNILCIIDAAHALGSIASLNLKNLNADILFGNCHKWWCGPKGTAFLYKSEGLSFNLKSASSSHGFGSGMEYIRILKILFKFILIGFHSDFLWTGLKDYCAFLALDGTLDLWSKLSDNLNAPIDYCVSLAHKAAKMLKTKWKTEFLVDPQFCASMICVKLPKKFIDKCLIDSNAMPSDSLLTYTEAEIIQNYLYFKQKIEIPIKSIQNELYVRISSHIYNKFSDYEYLAYVVDI